MAGFESLRGFRTLQPDERARLSSATHERSVAKGARLFSEGQPGDAVWAVKQGLIHIIKSGPAGRDMVVELIAPGELFGAVAALEKRAYPASAVAAEDSIVWSIPGSLARELCQKHPALRSVVLEQITARLRSAHARLQSVALEPVEQRLARQVLTLAEKLGHEKGSMTVVGVTRQDLADMIGTTVETTIRITSKWQRAGIIRSGRQQLGLADLDRLAAIARGTNKKD